MRRIVSLLFAGLLALSMAWHLAVQAEHHDKELPTVTILGPQWQYHVAAYEDLFKEKDFVFLGEKEELAEMQDGLNRLGQEGWELVEVKETFLVFKRPVVEGE